MSTSTTPRLLAPEGSGKDRRSASSAPGAVGFDSCRADRVGWIKRAQIADAQVRAMVGNGSTTSTSQSGMSRVRTGSWARVPQAAEASAVFAYIGGADVASDPPALGHFALTTTRCSPSHGLEPGRPFDRELRDAVDDVLAADTPGSEIARTAWRDAA